MRVIDDLMAIDFMSSRNLRRRVSEIYGEFFAFMPIANGHVYATNRRLTLSRSADAEADVADGFAAEALF